MTIGTRHLEHCGSSSRHLIAQNVPSTLSTCRPRGNACDVVGELKGPSRLLICCPFPNQPWMWDMTHDFGGTHFPLIPALGRKTGETKKTRHKINVRKHREAEEKNAPLDKTGLCLVMSKWAKMTIFPTKWRANEQQGEGWAPTRQLWQLFADHSYSAYLACFM